MAMDQRQKLYARGHSHSSLVMPTCTLCMHVCMYVKSNDPAREFAEQPYHANPNLVYAYVRVYMYVCK
jgi:hypothetical protein